ncbi:hypothetical protein TESG_08589 [Trichophyton tonsurans CBS 112818]|uniref:Uncharacterized protein n=1 Tax=Trichophyton tonsurans (strain CBS 112818) TaxID=647933 RepID=F2S6P3_TRIT1|nr:hypothetical protein TESG_08589 [Trichophyton tonsurans CBS 112818]
MSGYTEYQEEHRARRQAAFRGGFTAPTRSSPCYGMEKLFLESEWSDEQVEAPEAYGVGDELGPRHIYSGLRRSGEDPVHPQVDGDDPV